MNNLNEEIEKYQLSRLQENAERLAKDLERLAQHVRDEARDFQKVSQSRRYGNVVASIQHAVLWGVANLSIDRLVTIAMEADVAAVGGFHDLGLEK